MASKQKSVQVLAVYTFKSNASRVCFSVKSSNGIDTYNTCFNGDKSSCSCKAGERGIKCYHQVQLAERAAKLMTPCKVEQVVPAYSTSEQRAAAPLNARNAGFQLMR